MSLPVITKDYILKGPPRTFLKGVNAAEFVLSRVKGYGNAPALIDSTNGDKVTFLQIYEEAITIAEVLRSKGIKPGDTVAICSENRFEFPAPVLATLAIGATCAPLNPIYTTGELIHTMSISQPCIVFCSPFTAVKLNEVRPSLKCVKELIVFGEVESDEKFTSYRELLKRPVNINNFKYAPVSDARGDVAVNLCSSGTTGLPKCVELTHKNVLAFVEYFVDPNLSAIANENDVLLGLIPFFHGYGWGILLVSLAAKTPIVVMSKFEERQFLEALQNYKVTVLFAVPPLIVFLGKHPLVSQYDLSSLRHIGCGAAPLSKEAQLAAAERLNCHNIVQGYGMTELSIACVLTPPWLEINKIGSSGIVASGMECKVVDLNTGKALPPYKEGELCFKGPFVMKGYRNNRKATEEMIEPNGWLHTGDIGYYDDEGFLYIVDRLKELIKYKGFQVPPAELEALLLTHPGVKDAAVIGIPDEEAGELPFAFVVRQPDSKVTADEIKSFVVGKVSPQKRLHGGVKFVNEIPKNPSGKILRRELRALMKKSKL